MILLLLGLSIRLTLGWWFYGTFDVSSWIHALRDFSQGINPYKFGKLNWPPVWPSLLYIVNKAQTFYDLPPERDYFYVKIFPIVIDTCIGIAIYTWMLEQIGEPKVAFRRALWYVLNPIAIAVCAVLGQFDALPGLFVLLATLATLKDRNGNRWLPSALWFSLAILAKAWPLILLPAMVRPVRGSMFRLLYTLIAIVPTVISLYLLYRLAPVEINKYVLHYNGATAPYGLDTPIAWTSVAFKRVYSRWILNLLYVTLILVYAALWKRNTPGRMIFMGLLTFFTFTPAFGATYLVWILGVSLVVDFKRARGFALVGSFTTLMYLIFSPYNGELFGAVSHLHSKSFWTATFSHQAQVFTAFGNLPTWLYFAWWWVAFLRESLSSPEDRPIQPVLDSGNAALEAQST